MTFKMTKNFAIATAAATLMIAAGAPAQGQIIHKTGRKGRRIAGAIALGLIGAAVIAGSARASRYDHADRYERRCNKWRRWCRNGEDRACWKYENRC